MFCGGFTPSGDSRGPCESSGRAPRGSRHRKTPKRVKQNNRFFPRGLFRPFTNKKANFSMQCFPKCAHLDAPTSTLVTSSQFTVACDKMKRHEIILNSQLSCFVDISPPFRAYAAGLGEHGGREPLVKYGALAISEASKIARAPCFAGGSRPRGTPEALTTAPEGVNPRKTRCPSDFRGLEDR